jgi:hypothetical protein
VKIRFWVGPTNKKKRTPCNPSIGDSEFPRQPSGLWHPEKNKEMGSARTAIDISLEVSMDKADLLARGKEQRRVKT